MAHTVKLRDLGAENLRSRMLNRDSALHRRHRLSAVELLEQSKKQYIKTESVLDHLQNQPKTPTSSVSSWQVGDSGEVQQSCKEKQSHDPNNLSRTPQAASSFIDGNRRQQPNSADYAENMCHLNHHHHHKPRPKTVELSDPHCVNFTCEDDVECVQSDLSELSLKRTKYNHREIAMEVEAEPVSVHSDDVDKGKQHACTEIPSFDDCREIQPMSQDHYLVSSQVLAEVKRRHRKVLSRSRSDTGKRMSSNSDISEISAHLSRNSADLEKFFDEMGLERSVLDPMMATQELLGEPTNSIISNFMDSVSSIDSLDARSWYSNESQRIEQGLKCTELLDCTNNQTSVVERNARIIKWLYSVRRATTPTKDIPQQQ